MALITMSVMMERKDGDRFVMVFAVTNALEIHKLQTAPLLEVILRKSSANCLPRRHQY